VEDGIDDLLGATELVGAGADVLSCHGLGLHEASHHDGRVVRVAHLPRGFAYDVFYNLLGDAHGRGLLS
jgi:hypothetical protein